MNKRSILPCYVGLGRGVATASPGLTANRWFASLTEVQKVKVSRLRDRSERDYWWNHLPIEKRVAIMDKFWKKDCTFGLKSLSTMATIGKTIVYTYRKESVNKDISYY